MKLVWICTVWGMEGLPAKEKLGRAKAAGYDGVEMSLPVDLKERRELRDLLDGQQFHACLVSFMRLVSSLVRTTPHRTFWGDGCHLNRMTKCARLATTSTFAGTLVHCHAGGRPNNEGAPHLNAGWF